MIGGFPKEVMSVLDSIYSLIAREKPTWHLDCLPDGRRGEEVRPANLVGPPGGGGQVSDGDGGGVGKQESVGRQDFVQHRECLLLRLYLLYDSLDSRVCNGHLFQIKGPVYTIVVLLCLFFRECTALCET